MLTIGIILGVLLLVAAAVIAYLAFFGKSDSSKVLFGTGYKDNGSRFSLQNERTTFSPSETVAWVGNLSDDVDPKTLRRTIARVNSDGSRTVLVNHAVQLKSQTSSTINQVAVKESVASLEEVGVNPPGTYEVTYLSHGKKEATGTFTLTGASPVGKIFFGTSASDGVITGTAQHSTFGRKDSMIYAAHFAGTEGPGKLQVKIVRIGSDGTEQVISSGLYDNLRSSGIRIRVNEISVADMPGYGANKSGIYLLRYFKGKTLLAEGKFTLTL